VAGDKRPNSATTFASTQHTPDRRRRRDAECCEDTVRDDQRGGYPEHAEGSSRQLSGLLSGLTPHSGNGAGGWAPPRN
jgi:hypothetical protein